LILTRSTSPPRSVPSACVRVCSLHYKPSVKTTHSEDTRAARNHAHQRMRHEVNRCEDGCKKINRSHTHTDREQHPRHRHTHTRQEQHPKPPNEHLPQTLNNARRWRDDGACHLPRPGGWLRRTTHCEDACRARNRSAT